MLFVFMSLLVVLFSMFLVMFMMVMMVFFSFFMLCSKEWVKLRFFEPRRATTYLCDGPRGVFYVLYHASYACGDDVSTV